MDYKTTYKVVSGVKTTFEKELNELSKEGYLWNGMMNTTVNGTSVLYSILMSKTERIES